MVANRWRALCHKAKWRTVRDKKIRCANYFEEFYRYLDQLWQRFNIFYLRRVQFEVSTQFVMVTT